MKPTITAIIESLLNPTERFQTIKQITPISDAIGTPRFTIKSDCIVFDAIINNNKSNIIIPIGWSEKQSIDAYHESKRSTMIGSYIAHCQYKKKELISFDTSGIAIKNDIIIETILDGTPLPIFLRRHLDRNGLFKIRELLSHFEQAYLSLQKGSLCHGRIRADSIIVDTNGKLTLINYIHSKKRSQSEDNFALLYLALLTFTTACEPSLNQFIWHSPPTKKSHLLNLILFQAEFNRDNALIEVINLLLNPHLLCSEKTLNALHTISQKPFVELPLLRSLALDSNNSDIVSIDINTTKTPHHKIDTTLALDFSKCNFIGAISDSLIRYKENNLWGFVDSFGNKINDTTYNDAQDFYEGRAAVSINNLYGLIDTTGNFVMEPIYETLEWHGPDNVVIAAHEGEWQLYDRGGKTLNAIKYHWIGEPSCGILLVKRNNKYGFIRSNGDPLTDLRFDEAFSFSQNKALVSINGTSYYIDANGKKTL